MSNFDDINKIYKASSYLDKYGSDVWIAIIIFLGFFIITSYYFILNNIQPIAADWDNQKCNPAVMPFAGLINKGENESAQDFTSKNFNGCIQNVLTGVAATAFQPVHYTLNNLTSSFNGLTDSVNSIRTMTNNVRNSTKTFTEDVMGRVLNVTMPITQLMIGVKSMGAKIVGVLTTSLFTLYASYLTLKSSLAFILSLLTTILIILAALIVTFLIISAVPIFGSWAIPVAATNIAIMIGILIPTLILKMFLSDILSMSSKSLPKVPRCFHGETLIDVLNSEEETIKKPLSFIEIGDKLVNGSSVTAVMKFSASDQIIYNVDGVLVSGEHRILHDTLGWIKVKEHPNRILMREFNEPYLYCLGTDMKTFTIENSHGAQQVYSDWDDVDDDLIKKMSPYLKCQSPVTDYKDIHKYLDNGVDGYTLIELNSNNCIPIKYIQVNDVLIDGSRVLGVIKIDATKLDGFYKYKTINGSGNIIGFNVSLDKQYKREKISINEKYLYQILTDTGSFSVNGISVMDYNFCIDTL